MRPAAPAPGVPIYRWQQPKQVRGHCYPVEDLRERDQDGKPVDRPRRPIGFDPKRAT